MTVQCGVRVLSRLHKSVPAQQPSSVPCKLALIEESPGIDDLCSGKILTGYQGQLLNKALRLANIDRGELFITYLFNEALPNDDIRKVGLRKWVSEEYYGYTPRRLPGTGYLPPEIEQQFERVAKELEAVAPAVILPMGSTCLWAFTGQTAITKARGAIDRATYIAPGAKILPTFRAGHVHRAYKMLGTWINDFKKASLEAGAGEQLTLSPRQLWLAPTLMDMEIFFERYLVGAECICVDIETAKGQITDIGFGISSELAISIPFVDYRQPSRSYWPTLDHEFSAWAWVQRVLDLPAPKLFQNGPYDCFWFVRNGLRVRNYCFDTRLQHHALYPELPKDLAYMSSVYCNNGPWKLLADHSHVEDPFIGDTKRDN
jgi:uracil-DNA glycosylase